MKLTRYLKIAVLAAPLLLTACGSHKKVTKEQPNPEEVAEVAKQQQFLQKVQSNSQENKFVTSKLKFTVEVGQQKVGLTGNLKMKRDDVIRLQLMAFGFVEAGRLEFTKDYVLIMDRINKQYLKLPYNYVDFLRESGINFYTLQALFWNELFMPGQPTLTEEGRKKFSATLGGEDVVISYDADTKLTCSWLANDKTGVIKMANILYKDRFKGNSQLNWDYLDFKTLNKKVFPTSMNVTLTTLEKDIRLGITLSYLGNDENWETRTVVSDKYREVSVDEILRRFMAL